jgi:putrescine transport system substrate-binding protein
MVPTVLNYLGEQPNSFDEAVIDKAAQVMDGVRTHLRYYHSSQYINDLANGDICVAVGWSGDVFQARDRADEAGNGVVIDYVIPKEGGIMWFDMMAIPKDAKNVDEAYALIDYLLKPDVMADIQNYVTYASANTAALPMVDEEIRNNPAVYPPEEVKAKLFTLAVLPPEVDRIYTRLWTRLKTGR